MSKKALFSLGLAALFVTGCSEREKQKVREVSDAAGQKAGEVIKEGVRMAQDPEVQRKVKEAATDAYEVTESAIGGFWGGLKRAVETNSTPPTTPDPHP